MSFMSIAKPSWLKRKLRFEALREYFISGHRCIQE
jgi:hypothetical protein